MKFVVLDFETASAANLKKTGATVYAEHPSTEIICLAYSIDGLPAKLMTPDDLPWKMVRFDEHMDFNTAVNTPGVFFIAHGAMFEQAIWREIMAKQYGWPSLPPERWHDTQAVCAMKGLPLGLERVGAILRLPTVKDMEGRKITLGFSKTNKKGYYERDPKDLARSYSYCKGDVSEELELHRRVRSLGNEERRVWLLDQAINARGVRLDMQFVEKAQEVCDQASRPLRAEFERLTGIEKTGSPKFLAWLQAQGSNIPNLQKGTIGKYLGVTDDEEDEDDEEDGQAASDIADEDMRLPDHCRRPLEIRKVVGSASIKKLVAMRACCAGDGRAHGLLQYHGAGPGRWSGRLLQPQNFPRPTLKIFTGFKDEAEIWEGHKPEELVASILSGDAERVRADYGEPIEAVANALRHAIVSAPGRALEVGDFAQIEARIVLAVAGQHDKTEAMAKGQNPYIPMAESIFGRKIDKHVDVFEYTIGKNTVLGCGFQMGAAKYHERYCPHMPLAFAQKCIDTYRKVECPRVPAVWYELEEASACAVWERRACEAYGVSYQLEGEWLTARLPSGRRLWYYGPQPVKGSQYRNPRTGKLDWLYQDTDRHFLRAPGLPRVPDDFDFSWCNGVTKKCWSYWCWKGGKWIMRVAYGGLLTENVVQGLARDLLVSAMFKCEEMGRNTVLTVHDELVNEPDDFLADPGLLDSIMCDAPQWAREIKVPLQTDCWTGQRYRK